MTVAELIGKLKEMPPDAMVVAEGYEDDKYSVESVL